MKVASARSGGQRNWITAFRRSSFGRAVIRRLPTRVKGWLRTGRRWQRSVIAKVKLRWHRSLQLRVVSTTLVLSVLVIAVLGFFLVQSVAAGLYNSAEASALAQVKAGLVSAIGQSNPNVLDPGNTQATVNAARITARTLQQASGNTGSYLVFIQLTNVEPAIVEWVGDTDVNIGATIPATLINRVTANQRIERLNYQSTVPLNYEPTTLVYNPGQGASVPALAVGVPLGSKFRLYYVFPFTQQQATLMLVQRVLVGWASRSWFCWPRSRRW